MNSHLLSEDFDVVFVNIANINKNIFSNKRLLKAYVSDLYCGRRNDLRIFLSIIDSIPDGYLNRQNVSEDDFNTVDFPKFDILDDSETSDYLIRILYTIYVNRSFNFTDKRTKKKISHLKATKIDEFKPNKTIVFKGDDVTFSWKVNRPAKLLFFNEDKSIDVTDQNSIKLSVLTNNYYLVLFDDKNKQIDRKQIRLTISTPCYCINCGERFYDKTDIYCTHCGTKKI